jgi:hypothetical protein
MSWLPEVFELNPGGVNWLRAVMFLDVVLVPLVMCLTARKEQYLVRGVRRGAGRSSRPRGRLWFPRIAQRRLRRVGA